MGCCFNSPEVGPSTYFSDNATVLQWLKALDDTEEQLEQISGSHGGDMTFRVFLNIAPCSLIALMMEAVRISETSVHSNKTTRRYIPEDSKHSNRADFDDGRSKRLWNIGQFISDCKA
jgi:hypothetical protein